MIGDDFGLVWIFHRVQYGFNCLHIFSSVGYDIILFLISAPPSEVLCSNPNKLCREYNNCFTRNGTQKDRVGSFFKRLPMLFFERLPWTKCALRWRGCASVLSRFPPAKFFRAILTSFARKDTSAGNSFAVSILTNHTRNHTLHNTTNAQIQSVNSWISSSSTLTQPSCTENPPKTEDSTIGFDLIAQKTMSCRLRLYGTHSACTLCTNPLTHGPFSTLSFFLFVPGDQWSPGNLPQQQKQAQSQTSRN